MSQTSNMSPPTARGDDFYSTPGIMTDLTGCRADVFEGLPADPRALCHLVQGLLIHEFWASWRAGNTSWRGPSNGKLQSSRLTMSGPPDRR